MTLEPKSIKFATAIAVTFAVAAVIAFLVTGTGTAAAYQPETEDVRYLIDPPATCDVDPDDCVGTARARQSKGSPSQWNGNRHHQEALESRLSNPTEWNAGTNSPPSGKVLAAVTSEAQSLPWVLDGINQDEKLTMTALSLLDDVDPQLASQVVKQPFLQHHNVHDFNAVYSLYQIAYGNAFYANAILDWYDNGRGGINENDAHVVSTLALPFGQGQYNTIYSLISSGAIEHASYPMMGGGAGTVAVVRPRFQQTGPATMAVTESIKHAQKLMNGSIGISHIPVLVADAEDAGGYNDGYGIWIDESYEQDGLSGLLQQVAGHEIGHFWWNRKHHDDWLSEAAAQYMGSYSVWSRYDHSDVYTWQSPCPYYRTIEHMRADAPQYAVANGWLCQYSLGERLFVNLDRNMDTAAFESAFRKLYRDTVAPTTKQNKDQGQILVESFCPNCVGLGTLRNKGSAAFTIAKHYGNKIITDQSPVNGQIAGLGTPNGNASIENWSRSNRQYGMATLPASTQDNRRWVRIWFNNPTGADRKETVKVNVRRFHEDHQAWGRYSSTAYVTVKNGTAYMEVYLGNPDHRAAGHHWVYVYDDKWRKLADVQYQVVP